MFSSQRTKRKKRELDIFAFMLLTLNSRNREQRLLILAKWRLKYYSLAVFRDYELGTRLLNAFLRSYKECRQGKVDVARVAIRMAAQFFSVILSTPLHEVTQEDVQGIAKMGRDLIRMGWEKDEAGLRNSIAGALMDE